MPPVCNIEDLPIDVMYTAVKRKILHGSCGYYYILRMRQNGLANPDAEGILASQYILVRITNGAVYDYIENKLDNYKFTVVRTRDIDDNIVFHVSNRNDWIVYVNQPGNADSTDIDRV